MKLISFLAVLFASAPAAAGVSIICWDSYDSKKIPVVQIEKSTDGSSTLVVLKAIDDGEGASIPKGLYKQGVDLTKDDAGVWTATMSADQFVSEESRGFTFEAADLSIIAGPNDESVLDFSERDECGSTTSRVSLTLTCNGF